MWSRDLHAGRPTPADELPRPGNRSGSAAAEAPVLRTAGRTCPSPPKQHYWPIQIENTYNCEYFCTLSSWQHCKVRENGALAGTLLLLFSDWNIAAGAVYGSQVPKLALCSHIFIVLLLRGDINIRGYTGNTLSFCYLMKHSRAEQISQHNLWTSYCTFWEVLIQFHTTEMHIVQS